TNLPRDVIPSFLIGHHPSGPREMGRTPCQNVSRFVTAKEVGKRELCPFLQGRPGALLVSEFVKELSEQKAMRELLLTACPFPEAVLRGSRLAALGVNARQHEIGPVVFWPQPLALHANTACSVVVLGAIKSRNQGLPMNDPFRIMFDASLQLAGSALL